MTSQYLSVQTSLQAPFSWNSNDNARSLKMYASFWGVRVDVVGRIWYQSKSWPQTYDLNAHTGPVLYRFGATHITYRQTDTVFETIGDTVSTFRLKSHRPLLPVAVEVTFLARCVDVSWSSLNK